MKAALIHFELWFLNEKEYRFDYLNEINFHIVMNEIKQKISKHSIDTIIGEMWADGWAYKDTDDWYSFLKRVQDASIKIGIKNFYLAVGQCHDYQHEINKRNLRFKIIEYHWPIQEIVNSYRRYNGIKKIQHWNSNTHKFFIPGGSPARPKRIGLLSKFYDANMLKNAEWSFFPPWTDHDKKWCRDYLNNYSDEDYNNFLKYCTRELDPFYNQIYKYSQMTGYDLAKQKIFDQPWWSMVGYIDNKFFNSTSISVVNEGPGNDKRFLTEKLWLTIFNNHPFILVDFPERFQYCKDIGLRMFEDYMKVKDYGYIEDPELQMQAAVENTKYFLQNLNQNKDKIKKDIEHNYKIFKEHEKHNNMQKLFLNSIIVDRDVYKYLDDLHLGRYIDIPKISEIPKYTE